MIDIDNIKIVKTPGNKLSMEHGIFKQIVTKKDLINFVENKILPALNSIDREDFDYVLGRVYDEGL